MVRKEEILQSLSLDSMFLHYYLGYPMDNFNVANFSGQNQIAFKGYSQIIESDDVVRRIIIMVGDETANHTGI